MAQTDSKGRYRFNAIRSGTYDLRATMPGYRETNKPGQILSENRNAAVDLVLEKDAAGQTEKSAEQLSLEYSDQPQFTVAGVTDPTNLGGHGSDVLVRTKEELAKETASLNRSAPESTKAGASGPADAEKNIRALLAREDRANLHESLADIEEREGRPLEAVREYQKAAEMEPSEAYLFSWGAELLLHRAPEPAAEVFAKGRRLFPQSAQMLEGLGVAAYARGSNEEAVELLLSACDLNPSDPNSYSLLAKIQDSEKLAIPGWAERLERFVSLQPENAPALYYYAVALSKENRMSGNFEQVERLLQKAIELDPHLGGAYLQLGILYSERKDLPKAIDAYQKAIENTPLPAEAHFRLAEAYRQSGEKLKARQEIDIYEQISKQKTEQADRDRHEIPEFVYKLKGQTTPSQTPASVPH